MKTKILSISLIAILLIGCNKAERAESAHDNSEAKDMAMASDSIAVVASQTIKDKQFVKTAEVDMEVRDVYDATISIEKQLVSMGGFVTQSRLEAQTMSEDTYNISDESSMLVRKYQNQNKMQVRVPTEKLGEFLTFINDKKVFLNSRIISAEDVSAGIRLAKMESERQAKTQSNISQLKAGKDKVNLDDNNMSEANMQKYSDEILADNLKFSTVDIFIKEPKTSVAKIPIINTKNIDNEYKYNFFYDVKNAFVEGFYLIQQLFVFLISIWPIVLIGGLVFYFLRKRKAFVKTEK
ncbi:DUF4349 domain-containing protein [Epilithonimonas hominis]|uniref:DUF4349 domain-containing protein n=1 Tax=Epilithonimonas hominis TaxID=420404 RepID=A0A3N0X3F9_9FLAO|nr:DUF4349 domain-containing protein [Epilithonimonas hominis]ROI11421.1 DUF4349 domain-containing protein [Epilithonimonas hominis]